MLSSNVRLKSKMGRPDGQNQSSACQNMSSDVVIQRQRDVLKEMQEERNGQCCIKSVLGVVRAYMRGAVDYVRPRPQPPAGPLLFFVD